MKALPNSQSAENFRKHNHSVCYVTLRLYWCSWHHVFRKVQKSKTRENEKHKGREKKKKASFPVCKSRWRNTWAVSCPGSRNSQRRSLLYSKYLPLLYMTELEQWTLKPVLKALKYFLSRTVFPITYSRCFSSCGLGYISHMYFIHSCTEKEWKGALQSFNPVSNPELEIHVLELLRSRLAPFWCLKASAYLMTDQLHEVLAMKQQQVV